MKKNETKKNRVKTLGKKQMLLNIGGLSKGDKAYCGPYGTIQCYKAASETRTGKRMFKVSGSQRLQNRGNWTMTALREAIEK